MVLKGKVALITGGSRGIGFAIAEAFAREGANLFLVARAKEELEDAKKKLEAHGARVEIFAGDVSNEMVADAVSKELSRVDILVNAAGIYGPIGRFEDISPEEWRKTIDVNLTGTFLFTRMAVPFMKAQDRGKIINFAGGGEGPRPQFIPYATSKGAIIRFTESVVADLAEYHIDVNAIAPGAVNTHFLEELLAAGPKKTGEEMYRKALEQKKNGGVSSRHAAELCVFLASTKSDGLSGKILSAVHDDYEKIPERLASIMNSDAYTYRRIKPNDK